MRICRQVPSDGFLEILQPLAASEQGVGCNSTTVFMTHGAKDFPIPSAFYLSVSKANVPDHIGLVLVLTPILLTDAGPVFSVTCSRCCLNTSIAIASAEGMTGAVEFDFITLSKLVVIDL